MSIRYRYRKQIIGLFLVFIVVSISGFSIYKMAGTSKKKVEKRVLVASKRSSNVKKVSTKNEEKLEGEYKVDIKGEIQNPGLYSLKEGSRVSDVISLAGGLTENGDTSVINLSKKISDEMVIIIYSREEVRDFKVTKDIEKKVFEKCQNSYEGVINDVCSEVTDDSSEEEVLQVVSINKADISQLQSIDGIGLAKAQNIVSYREEHGEFKSIDELKNVTGIGEAIFDKIKNNITL